MQGTAVSQIGRYRVLRELGQGSMGSVYLGHDPVIDRRVALKTVRLDGLSEAEATGYRRRFRVEAQAAGRLSHPGVVTVYDVGEDETLRRPYIVMEYVDGQPLQALVDAPPGRLPPAAALDIARQVAEALDYAHAGGVLHRDVKPANVSVTADGRAVLTDFGIAHLRRLREGAAQEEFGTLAFMAPERVQGQRTDGRADLFSLGVVLYLLLTGEKPFTGNDDEVMFKLVFRDPEPPSRRIPELAPALDAVLATALAKKPEERFQTGKEFAAALERAASAEVAAPARDPDPPEAPHEPPETAGRGWRRLLLAAAVLAAASVLAWVVVDP